MPHEVQTTSTFTTHVPETIRLPAPGAVDPIFSLRRGWFYHAAAEGRLKLIRLVGRGKKRGVTLVRTADVLALINEASNQ